MFGKKWELSRTISDLDLISGWVEVIPQAQRKVLWHEKIITSQPEGYQIYHLNYLGNGRLAVSFATGENKGRFFQEFDLRQKISTSIHQCREDLYASSLEVINRGHFILKHDVKGPRKNYIMRSVYRRVK